MNITFNHLSSTSKTLLHSINFELYTNKIVFENGTTIKIVERGSDYKYLYRNLKNIYVANFNEFKEHLLKSLDDTNIFHHSMFHALYKYIK
jgi:hypothetical protein